MTTVSYANFKRPDCTHIPPLCQSNSLMILTQQRYFDLSQYKSCDQIKHFFNITYFLNLRCFILDKALDFPYTTKSVTMYCKLLYFKHKNAAQSQIG